MVIKYAGVFADRQLKNGRRDPAMMTSRHRNAFRITNLLWGNPPVTSGFHTQRVRSVGLWWSFNVTSSLNKLINRCSSWRWFETHDAHVIPWSWLDIPWWRHQMETFSALLAFCVGNSPVPGEFPAQRPVTRIFDIFFDLRLNKQFTKQSWGWWYETPSRSSWRHCNPSTHKPIMA